MQGVHLKNSLAAAIASTFSLLSIGAWATDLHVTNCNDSGAGSLRAMIASAADTGDRVVFDTGTMNCSAITLTSGELAVANAEITLQGPSQSTLTIDGNHAGRVIAAQKATSQGYVDTTTKITINNLTLQNGSITIASDQGLAAGGCLVVGGDLILNSSTVTGCAATNTIGSVAGGGIFGATFHIYNSRVTNSSVSGATTTSNLINSNGAGIASFQASDVVISSSVISGNTTIVSGTNAFRLGGGIFLSVPQDGKLSITATSVVNNQADSGGGAYVYGASTDSSSLAIDRSTFASNTAAIAGGLSVNNPLATLNVTNSTFSGNSASNLIGGVAATANSAFTNDTIAFNTAANKTYTSSFNNMVYNIGAGLSFSGQLTNTIIARNTAASTEWDMDSGGTTVAGSHNLIMLTVSGTTAPSGTLTADPMLSALGNFGGPTQVHGLMAGSPAIDAGNPCTANLPTSDERGLGFPRIWGSAPDIGAFEYGDPASGDVIFLGTFEGQACSP